MYAIRFRPGIWRRSGGSLLQSLGALLLIMTGNIRELRNLLDLAVLLGGADVITAR